MKIKIVGLGSGSIDSISLGAYKTLENSENIYVRTFKHPIISDLIQEGISLQSFDHFYEEAANFEATYGRIAEELIHLAQAKEEIVYAVPGHPRVAETAVDLLLAHDQVMNGEIQVEIISSVSFLDDLFIFLDVDPVQNGFLLLDALKFDSTVLFSPSDFIFTQVYSKLIASDLKLKLLELLADETAVILFKAAGIKGLEEKKELKLYELDWGEFEFDHLTSLYIPYKRENQKFHSIYNLAEIMKTLRGENGCPWDQKQTPKSLMRHIIGEVEELKTAVENDDIDNIIEELGDVLMLLVMQAELGREEELFHLNDVIDGVSKKLIFRHPHVFGDEKVSSLEEADLLWEKQKGREKANKV